MSWRGRIWRVCCDGFRKRLLTFANEQRQTQWSALQPAGLTQKLPPERLVALYPGRKALGEQRALTRPCPPAALLDLHLALHLKRRVNPDHQIDFPGQSWPIAPTKRSAITLIHHRLRQFWVVTQTLGPPLNNWPEILGKYSL